MMMAEAEKGLANLQVWQRALAFAVRLNREVATRLPPEEKWCLGPQMRRAAQSIPANIAEGFGRYYYQETVRFCYYARGSLEEVYSHLAYAHQMGYFSDDGITSLNQEIQELRRMLNGYIQYLKRSKRGDGEPGSARVVKEASYPYDFDEAESCNGEPSSEF